MVASRVEVFSRSASDPTQQHYWSSDGSGSYELATADGVTQGTKIVMHLRDDAVNAVVDGAAHHACPDRYVDGAAGAVGLDVSDLWHRQTKLQFGRIASGMLA